MESALLKFDQGKAILSCLSADGGRKIWIKKLPDINYISNIIEDKDKYYISCESGEINGQFVAVFKKNGSTEWFIPGRSFIQVLFDGFIYLIFPDDKSRFYFLKIRRDDGSTAWYHPVDRDLLEYGFSKNSICLEYGSGRKEYISVRTGDVIQAG